MAGKKKKKPSANPARGFATVSLPSKTKELVRTDDEEPTNRVFGADSENLHEPQPPLVGGDENLNNESSNSENNPIEKMSPADLEVYLEDVELRNLVEQHASQIKSDSLRHAARLQNERHQLRQKAERAYFHVLTPGLIDDIVSRLTRMQATSSESGTSHWMSVTNDGDMLLKLWLLQETLNQLNMNSIDDALTHVLHVRRLNGTEIGSNSVFGLDEALIWYAGHEEHEETPDLTDGNMHADGGNENTISNTVIGELESMKGRESSEAIENIPNADPRNMSAKGDSELTSSDEDDDPDGLVNRWIRLKTKSFNQQQDEITLDHENSRVADTRLNEKLQAIERDVLFDRDLAWQRWKPTQRNLEIEIGRTKKKKKLKSPVIEQQPRASKNPEIDEAEDEVMLGDIFETANGGEQPQAATNSVEITTHLCFGLWTGVHPRQLLEEACADITIRGGLKFQPLYTTSFASRLQLDLNLNSTPRLDKLDIQCLPQGVVFVETPQHLILKMQAVATENNSQSEAYLSTIAIFLLTSANLINAKISLRLPKVWREVMTELERSRVALVFEDDVRKLKHLRNILRQSFQPSTAPSSVLDIPECSNETVANRTRNADSKRDYSDEAKSKWLERVSSERYACMQTERRDLPVHSYKEQILQEFHQNPVLIICADTGAGKSTQIPSYILESEMSAGRDFNILVTQPRRISAISIARRVSAEIGEDTGALGTSRSLVGYAIRMENRTSSTTRITFATTGVLLRMLQDSPNLNQVDCVILDEVHERTMDLDLLFIALKRLRMRRTSFKIILMSATVDASKFSTYFENAPVLAIPGRTFPVKLGFLEDAIEATLDIKLDTEQSTEISDNESTEDTDEPEASSAQAQGLDNYSIETRRVLAQYNHLRIDYHIILKLAIAIATKAEFSMYSNAILIFMPGIAEIRQLRRLLTSSSVFSKGWVIHMLHSSFSTQELEEAFLLPPRGFRKVVIATNIAETGITIPDVTAVIDTCKEKTVRFDERRQISRLMEGFIARASARQRRGRAARVQKGLCFHLVTKDQFETKLRDQSTPEMLQLSLQEPILRIKIWNLGSAEEVLSAALDPPSVKNIRRAISKLQDVGALDYSENLTMLGENLARLPLDVALGKMAIFGTFLQSLDAVITIIASFSVKSIFVQGAESSPVMTFARGDSDLLRVYSAYAGWRKASREEHGQQFCSKYHLNQFQLQQLEEQRIQLLAYLADAGLIALSSEERAALQHARRKKSKLFDFGVPPRYNRLDSDAIINGIVAMALYPKLLRREGRGYRNVQSNQQLQIAPLSINSIANTPPAWLCYLEAMQAENGILNAFHSSRVTSAMIVLLLGQADFKFFAGVVDIDHGRIRFSVRRRKELLALQGVRSQVQRMVREFLVRPESIPLSSDQWWLDVMVTLINGSFQPSVDPGRNMVQGQQS